MADLAPLLAITLAESQDASMSGLVRLLERSLSDPRRLRALLRFQAAVLTHGALTGEPGKFAFEPRAAMPPMFQAFPLQVSLPALAVEGVRRCGPPADLDRWRALTFARQATRGGNLDRSGLSAQELRVHSLLDGSQDLAGVSQKAGVELADVVVAARGFELAGLVERRNPTGRGAILLLEDDAETIHVVQKVLGPEGEGYPLKVARDRVSAQLLLRRTPFALVLMALDRGDHEAFYRAAREQCPAGTGFVGILTIEDEGELARSRRDGPRRRRPPAGVGGRPPDDRPAPADGPRGGRGLLNGTGRGGATPPGERERSA